MTDENAPQELESSSPHPGDQIGNVVVAPGNGISPNSGRTQQGSPRLSPIQKMADRQAFEDAESLEEEVDEGHYIYLDSKWLLKRIKLCARRDITNDFLKDDSDMEYEDLLKEYEEAYQRKFQEKMQPLAQWLISIQDEREKRLRDLLAQDRAHVQNRAPGAWHARDLVVARLLQIYYANNIEQIDIISVLREQHLFIDRYEKYVLDFESKSEVTWPTEDSFRP